MGSLCMAELIEHTCIPKLISHLGNQLNIREELWIGNKKQKSRKLMTLKPQPLETSPAKPLSVK